MRNEGDRVRVGKRLSLPSSFPEALDAVVQRFKKYMQAIENTRYILGVCGSMTYFQGCLFFPSLGPGVALLMSSPNFNHLAWTFPCRVSALG